MFELLPDAWKAWLRENVERGCDPEDLTDRLINGHAITPEGAALAVREAFAEAGRIVVARARPYADFRGGQVVLDEQTIRLVAESVSPRVLVLDTLLSAEECDSVIALGREKMNAIDVIDPQTGASVQHRDRRGEYATFQRAQTPLLAAIEARIAALLHWPVEKGEGFQVIHYRVGDEYRPHFDWFDPALPGSATHLQKGGQRIGTLVIYLNRPDHGGGTCFPKAGPLTVHPFPGSAVYFDNVDRQFAIDPNSLHSGDPVVAGEKWIATKWLRFETV